MKGYEDKWNSELDSELQWWSRFFNNNVEYDVTSDLRSRIDPLSPFPEHLRKLVDSKSAELKILDVGAGPLSLIGTFWPGGPSIDLYPIDPLADKYDILLQAAEICPRVRTISGEGEKINEQFPDNFFDLVQSHNALDHSYDPLRCFQSMYSALKNGGFIYTLHYPNEGHSSDYWGLHQWNFDIVESNFCIWNDKVRWFLKDYLPKGADIFPQYAQDEGGTRTVVVKIKKNF